MNINKTNYIAQKYSQLDTYLRGGIALLLCLLSGCQQNMSLQSRDVINRDNIGKMSEIIKLETELDNPIADMVISFDGQDLVLSQAGDEGIVQKWRLSDQKRLDKSIVEPVSVAGVTFDQSGSLLALTAGETDLTKDIGYSTNLSGVVVIDVETGVIKSEFGYGYGGERKEEGDLFSDVSLSSDGRWLIAVDKGGAVFWDIVEEKSLAAIVLGGSSVTAFNSNDKRAAIALENGVVNIYELSQATDATLKVDIIFNLQTIAEIPLAVAFSPDEQWVVCLGHSHLTFFNLERIDKVFKEAADLGSEYSEEKAKEYKEILSSMITEIKQNSILKPIPSSPVGDLAFNSTGDLLAIGTAAGWQIWDVAQQELLAEKEAEGVYAVTFSPDGRWFAWGDASGTVHLWAVGQ